MPADTQFRLRARYPAELGPAGLGGLVVLVLAGAAMALTHRSQQRRLCRSRRARSSTGHFRSPSPSDARPPRKLCR